MSHEHVVTDQNLANVMGYAEQPYQELLAVESDSQQRLAIANLATKAGLIAGRAYLKGLSENLDYYDDEEPLISVEYENTISEQLDQPLAALISDETASPSMISRIERSLFYSDTVTVRDVLIVGKRDLKFGRNLGDKSVEIISKTIDLMGIPYTLKDRPNVKDVVELCDNLSQIPFSRIPRLDIFTHVSDKISVGAIMIALADSNSEALGNLLGTKDEKLLGKVAAVARTFASQFNAIKQKLPKS